MLSFMSLSKALNALNAQNSSMLTLDKNKIDGLELEI